MTKADKGKILAKQAGECCKDDIIMRELLFPLQDVQPEFDKNEYSVNVFDDSDISEFI